MCPKDRFAQPAFPAGLISGWPPLPPANIQITTSPIPAMHGTLQTLLPVRSGKLLRRRRSPRTARGPASVSQKRSRASQTSGSLSTTRLHELSCSACDVIGVEDLKTKNMMARGKSGNRSKKAGLNRSIANASWNQFLRVLEFQAAKAEVIRLDPRNTTQCCPGCGTKAKSGLTLSDRTLRCDTCKLVLGRDKNAARNLNPGRSQNRLGCTGRDDGNSKTTCSAESVAA